MLVPLLSEKDPLVSTEGTIDPLGMYAIADSLAVRLVPGVRERQTHPRFLTTSAVALHLCADFDPEVVASDNISEPWQVFEWYVVEGLVRATKDEKALRGLPGRDKAARALKDTFPLSAARYLKTPSVFGFQGVYRTLARELGIDLAGSLGETGRELVRIWESEQGLDGFTGSVVGPGAEWRKSLERAIRDGLDQAATARSGGWGGWQFFRDHLSIYEVGTGESLFLQRLLLQDNEGHRGDVLRFLCSPEGYARFEESESEREFHRAMLESGSLPEPLRLLLLAIDVYERFCRLLEDAFDDCRFQMTDRSGRASALDLARLDGVLLAVREIPALFEQVLERFSALSGVDAVERFTGSFASLAERADSPEWVERLLKHHSRVQKDKPPRGRAPWIERLADGTWMIRSAYCRDSGGRHDDSYVHQYRTKPLLSFAADLDMVN